MPLGDKAGLVSVHEIDSTVLPHVAEITNKILEQVAVIVNGAFNGVEGERLLFMSGLDKVTVPLIEQSNLWRGELKRTNDLIERLLNEGVQVGGKR